MRGKKFQSKPANSSTRNSQRPLLIKRERIRSEESAEQNLFAATQKASGEFKHSARVSFMKQLKECQQCDQSLEETINKLSQTLTNTKKEQPLVKKLGAELVPLSSKGKKAIPVSLWTDDSQPPQDQPSKFKVRKLSQKNFEARADLIVEAAAANNLQNLPPQSQACQSQMDQCGFEDKIEEPLYGEKSPVMLNRRQRMLNSNDGSVGQDNFNNRFQELGNASGHHFNSPSLDLHTHAKLRDRLIGEEGADDAQNLPMSKKQFSQRDLQSKNTHMRLPSQQHQTYSESITSKPPMSGDDHYLMEHQHQHNLAYKSKVQRNHEELTKQSSLQDNYATTPLSSGQSGLNSQSQSNGQTNSYMSVAAKAGEMQIFSSDILYQVKGGIKSKKSKLLPNSKFRGSSNNQRMNQLQEQMNNVEEKMLQIDAIAPSGYYAQDPENEKHNSAPASLADGNHNTRNAKDPYFNEGVTGSSKFGSNLMVQEVVGRKPALFAKTNARASQMNGNTFGEYVACTARINLHGFASGPFSNAGYSTGNSVPLSTAQQPMAGSLVGTSSAMAHDSAAKQTSLISNSQSAIGPTQASSNSVAMANYGSRSGGGMNQHHYVPDSNMATNNIADKQLRIEMNHSSQHRPHAEATGLDQMGRFDGSAAPHHVRRSTGSRSASKQQQHQQQQHQQALADSAANFLEKTVHQLQNYNTTNDTKSPILNNPGLAKKLQQAKVTQQQVLPGRYGGATEGMLPKMQGVSLERKTNNGSKQATSMPPHAPSYTVDKQRRRPLESLAGNKMDFGIAGESLQIKLTGTGLIGKQPPRESFNFISKMENSALATANETASVQPPGPGGATLQLGQNIQMGIYHPKLRSRVPPPDASAMLGVAAQGQTPNGFAQQMAEMQMNSPRNVSQIFQENQGNPRMYAYHYIYDYLFVHVTQEQYQREYAQRIRVCQRTTPQPEDSPRDGREVGLGLECAAESHLSCGTTGAACPAAAARLEGSPGLQQPLRGPQLKLGQNKIFFSPQVKDDKERSTSLYTKEDSGRNQSFENLHEESKTKEAASKVESDSWAVPRKVTTLDKRRECLKIISNKAIQLTQFDGLKIMTRQSMVDTFRELSSKGLISDSAAVQAETHTGQTLQPIKLAKVQAALGDKEDEEVQKIMMELGSILSEQNQRFKVTVKKKYINDILMLSKGAQNLAQNVVIVVTNNSSLTMNSPKKYKRAKRNLSVDVSSDDEHAEPQEANIRVQGQATPQVISAKVKAHNIAKRGYESETEAKSLNSTTTSSTFPNLKNGQIPGPKQNNTPRQPRKMSTRSLSQIPQSVRIQRKTTEDINGNGATSAADQVDYYMSQFNERYPPTKIKIVQNTETNNMHAEHPINRMLSDYNEFTRLVFRTRVSENRAIQNIPYAIKLGRRLGMQLTKNQLMPATLKVRENANAVKERLIFHLIKVMQRENEFQPQMDPICQIFNKQISEHAVAHMEQVAEALAHLDPKQQGFHYKCYVGKGNNQMMVRALFKNRFWWLFQDKEEPEKVNFFWTQLRKLSIMNSLVCKMVNPKDKNQQRPVALATNANPGQSLGSAIAQNCALMTTPAANSKIKRRKLSSANSKSPEHLVAAKGSKQEAASSHSIANGTIGMTMIGLNKTSDTNVTAAAGSRNGADAASAFGTAEKPSAAATQSLTSPPPPKEESSTKRVEAISQVRKGGGGTHIEAHPLKLANKIEDNYHLANKKALFFNMKNYYEAVNQNPFDALPVTFHVKEGLEDPNFVQFRQYYEEHNDAHNIWILKPGECTNRGVGIQVAKDYAEIQQLVLESTRSRKRTCIVQKYIHNPLLINRRKFDIRTFCMATSYNGNYKAYYYQEGYLRTSCREFSLQNLSNRMVHLTNDAVQKKAEDYGKFEPGNKLSYTEFQNYLDKNHGQLNVCFERDILPQIKKLTTDCFRATWGKMDPYKRMNTFECFGLDFMIDDQFKVYLIEVNTNPCLELSSPLLARLIPQMIENALRLAVDPMFPPPENFSQRKTVVNELCPENKFELIFDERLEGPELAEIFREKDNVIIEIDEEELSDADIEDCKEANE